MSKAAVSQFTQVLAVECAENGILVNAIAPGEIETAILNYILEIDTGSHNGGAKGKKGGNGATGNGGCNGAVVNSEGSEDIIGRKENFQLPPGMK